MRFDHTVATPGDVWAVWIDVARVGHGARIGVQWRRPVGCRRERDSEAEEGTRPPGPTFPRRLARGRPPDSRKDVSSTRILPRPGAEHERGSAR